MLYLENLGDQLIRVKSWSGLILGKVSMGNLTHLRVDI